MLDSSGLSRSELFNPKKLKQKQKNLPIYKILVIGEKSTGKSSLILRYIENYYITNPPPTKEINFNTKIVKISPKESIELSIWDTAGSEKYESILQSYLTNCHGIVLCFDITNKKSFESLNKWVEMIHAYMREKRRESFYEKNNNEYIDNNDNNNKISKSRNNSKIDFKSANKNKFCFSLVGNKKDLEIEREVDYEDGEKFAEKLGCEYYETSAKNGKGVNDMFFDLAKDLYEKIDLDDYDYIFQNRESITLGEEYDKEFDIDRDEGVSGSCNCF